MQAEAWADAERKLALADPVALSAIELIYREARLLDDQRYRDWDELWAEGETRYVVPMRREVVDYDATLNFINDDSPMRRRRVDRMTSGHAGAVNAVGRTVRTVSRFAVDRIGDHELRVTSTEIVVAYKQGDHQVWAAELTHHILSADDRPCIRAKIVHLVDAEHTVRTCGFLL